MLVVHALAAAYIVPALLLAGRPVARGSLVDSYRTSALVVIGLLAAAWNIVYWTSGFYRRIYRLSPQVQARTGAKVRIRRSIEWDRPVGWRAAIGLQLRLLGLLVAAFSLWAALLTALVTLFIFMQEGPTGVVRFFVK